jgi:23S rRNA pseudouridine1911/1915/1917 synthase
MSREWRHRVTGSEAGERLDRFVQESVSGLTRSQVKRLIDQGHIRVDGAPVKAGHALRAGETLDVVVPPPPAVVPRPEALPVSVVYEDAWLAVVDKAAGMVVHPGAGRSTGTLVGALLGRGMVLSTIGAPFRPGIVHRLDKGTSGLLVVAKDDAAHRALSLALSERRIARRYAALVWGVPDPLRGTIAAPLGRSRADRRRVRVVAAGGRDAVTHYKVVDKGHGIGLLVLVLETGRTHQIRAHLKHRGHPVFGDPEYGGRGRRLGGLASGDRAPVRRALGRIARQALHAEGLRFAHPVTGKTLEFASDFPEDMQEAAAILGIAATTGNDKEDA